MVKVICIGMYNSEDNKNICNTHKEDIDGLADGEEGLPNIYNNDNKQ